MTRTSNTKGKGKRRGWWTEERKLKLCRAHEDNVPWEEIRENLFPDHTENALKQEYRRIKKRKPWLIGKFVHENGGSNNGNNSDNGGDDEDSSESEGESSNDSIKSDNDAATTVPSLQASPKTDKRSLPNASEERSETCPLKYVKIAPKPAANIVDLSCESEHLGGIEHTGYIMPFPNRANRGNNRQTRTGHAETPKASKIVILRIAVPSHRTMPDYINGQEAVTVMQMEQKTNDISTPTRESDASSHETVQQPTTREGQETSYSPVMHEFEDTVEVNCTVKKADYEVYCTLKEAAYCTLEKAFALQNDDKRRYQAELEVQKAKIKSLENQLAKEKGIRESREANLSSELKAKEKELKEYKASYEATVKELKEYQASVQASVKVSYNEFQKFIN